MLQNAGGVFLCDYCHVLANSGFKVVNKTELN